MNLFNSLSNHIVQSPEWGVFKTKVGKKTYRINGIQFSAHQLSLLPIKIGYCPKVNPFKIEWEKLIDLAKKENFCAVRFDVPNVSKNSKNVSRAESLLRQYCQKSPTDTFAKRTIILDLTKSEDQLLANMHPKTRYNIRLAQHKAVTVRNEGSKKGLEIFLKLQRKTADRQQFYVHPNNYYRKLWEILSPRGMAHILVAYFKNKPLVAWFLFLYEGILYYPYGGSSIEHRNFMASNLVAWEAILLGKRLNCKAFDMWGVADPEDKTDPWFGFTKFKQGYGGEIVEFIDSYDLIIDPFLYRIFTSAYRFGWKILRLKKKIISR